MPESITLVRRANAQALFQKHVERATAAGLPPKGLEQAFAAQLQISPSMWSQIKASRPIGDKLAWQIEVLCGKPEGWLDTAQASRPLMSAEQAFLDLALQAWRAGNAGTRKALKEQLKALLG